MDRDLTRARAVLIGNAAYRSDSGMPDLPAATGSVSAMSDLLTGELCGWPTDRIVPLVDVAAPSELARAVVGAVKTAEDVVLLYYVGHGLRTPKGQLALAVGDTGADPTLVGHTAMLYENVADILRGCRAATKLVILDCCHAELGNKANFVFQGAGDLTEAYPVDGLYCIWASKTHEKAKTPLDSALTYFTREFIATIRQGIPHLPAYIAMDQIFRELRGRMARQGLPEPVDSGIRGARQFPFARNAAFSARGASAQAMMPVPPPGSRLAGPAGRIDNGQWSKWLFGQEHLATIVTTIDNLCSNDGDYVTASEICEIVGLSHSRVHDIIRRLCGAGLLVAIRPSNGDRRCYYQVAASPRWDSLVSACAYD